jgi:cytosine/adenosine deaminase-related metal-dependent hydrolase
MEEVTGTVLAGESFEPTRGRVVVKDGRIEAVEETDTESTDIVLPAFVNAHTHLGDSVAKEAAVGLSLDEAVAATVAVPRMARPLACSGRPPRLRLVGAGVLPR